MSCWGGVYGQQGVLVIVLRDTSASPLSGNLCKPLKDPYKNPHKPSGIFTTALASPYGARVIMLMVPSQECSWKATGLLNEEMRMAQELDAEPGL